MFSLEFSTLYVEWAGRLDERKDSSRDDEQQPDEAVWGNMASLPSKVAMTLYVCESLSSIQLADLYGSRKEQEME